MARQAGADDVILYTQTDFESETKRLTANKGVDVVYDSVGKTTFEKGLNLLRPRGMMALFGGSSGAVPPFDLIQLSQKGSLYVTRPTLVNYTATREELVARSSAVFGMIAAGKLKFADRTQVSAGPSGTGAPGLGRQKDYREDITDSVAALRIVISTSPCEGDDLRFLPIQTMRSFGKSSLYGALSSVIRQSAACKAWAAITKSTSKRLGCPALPLRRRSA